MNFRKYGATNPLEAIALLDATIARETKLGNLANVYELKKVRAKKARKVTSENTVALCLESMLKATNQADVETLELSIGASKEVADRMVDNSIARAIAHETKQSHKN